MKDDKDTFNYNYSAINREEIEKIRNKYISTQETNFEKLKTFLNDLQSAKA